MLKSFLVRSSLHAERLLSGGPCGSMQLSWEWGVDPASPHGSPHSFSCGLPFLRPQSGVHRLHATVPFGSATDLAFISCFQVIPRHAAPFELCRHHAPTGLELDPFHYLEVIIVHGRSVTPPYPIRSPTIPGVIRKSIERLSQI